MIFPSLAAGVLIYGSNLYFNRQDMAIVLFNPSESKATYSEILQKKGKKMVSSQTTNDSMQNILLSRMFPNYKSNHSYKENQLFSGSPSIVLKGKNQENNNAKLFVMEKNEDADLTKLRNACVQALSQTAETSKNEIYKLKEWCTVPQVKDVLKRHKFKLISSDEHWKQVIQGEWLKEGNRDKQSFLTKDETTSWDSKSETDKINFLKTKCQQALEKPFERTNFPSPKIFLGSEKSADEFQEAAFFCVEPKTAKDYVSEAMKGTLATSLPNYMKKDFCYVQGKDSISDYENIKTTDAMDGKSFWCAVRMIYGKYNSSKAK